MEGNVPGSLAFHCILVLIYQACEIIAHHER